LFLLQVLRYLSLVVLRLCEHGHQQIYCQQHSSKIEFSILYSFLGITK
jgi:hypothetical protein